MEHKITIVSFDQKISTKDLTGFRGAIASMHPDNALYYNHENNSVIYRYPLIQYKFIEGKASVVGIDEGADFLEKDFQYGKTYHLNINGREYDFEVIDKKSIYYIPESYDQPCKYYFIKGWLPLNQENYNTYINLESISDKISLLDKILSANILSLFTGFDYYSEKQSQANILEIVSSRAIQYKGNDMLSFDVRVKCNANLPEFCGIGKGSSRGFGIVYNSHPRRK